MKILITGGNGYIARNLFQQLRSDFDVTTITRQEFDLADHAQTCRWFEGKYYDVVIHTAVVGGLRTVADDDSVVSKNLMMYYNLVACEECFGRFIAFGSGAEVSTPWEPYGFSKRIIAESMKHRSKYFNLRIRAVFSEDELGTRFIKANLLRYINHEPMVIHQDKYMDFFYMDDLVSLVKFYITAKDPILQDIDCCYNYNLTLLEIAKYINTLDEHKVSIKVQIDGTAPAYVGQYQPVLSPLVGLAEGMRRTYIKLKG